MDVETSGVEVEVVNHPALSLVISPGLSLGQVISTGLSLGLVISPGPTVLVSSPGPTVLAT